jgi:hypothetical protein
MVASHTEAWIYDYGGSDRYMKEIRGYPCRKPRISLVDHDLPLAHRLREGIAQRSHAARLGRRRRGRDVAVSS